MTCVGLTVSTPLVDGNVLGPGVRNRDGRIDDELGPSDDCIVGEREGV